MIPEGRSVGRKDSAVVDRQLTGIIDKSGVVPGGARLCVPSSERSSVPKAEDTRTNGAVDADRLRLVLQRLSSGFYSEGPPSQRIAAAVLADLKELEKGTSLPH
jgi:hypothetical protein